MTELGTASFGFRSVQGIALMLMLSTVLAMNAMTNGSNASYTGFCSDQELGQQIATKGTIVDLKTAASFVESSSLFMKLTNGLNATFRAIIDDWNVNEVKCEVVWHDVAVNYALQSSNGSRYLMTIGANPFLRIVYAASVSRDAIASVVPGTSKSYSGYALAGNSAHTTKLNYSQSEWYVPTVSMPPSGPNCETPPGDCRLDVWTGLQNSTYDGPPPTTSGEVIQTGTEGDVACVPYPPSCSISYTAWHAYVAGDALGGHITNTRGNCAWNPSPGDQVFAYVGNQQVVNGTAGPTFYTYIHDLTSGKACSYHRTLNPPHTGREYYADNFAERPACASDCLYSLPKFTNFIFYLCYMKDSTTGCYPYYNSGYGFGSYMYNGGTRETTTKSMIKYSGSDIGRFEEDWNSSSGT